MLGCLTSSLWMAQVEMGRGEILDFEVIAMQADNFGRHVGKMYDLEQPSGACSAASWLAACTGGAGMSNFKHMRRLGDGVISGVGQTQKRVSGSWLFFCGDYKANVANPPFAMSLRLSLPSHHNILDYSL